jgi:hypothetical protein
MEMDSIKVKDLLTSRAQTTLDLKAAIADSNKTPVAK